MKDGSDEFAAAEAVGGLDKFAEEVLLEFDGVDPALEFEELLVDFRAVVDVGEDAGPVLGFVVPVVVEEAGLAAGGGEQPDAAVGAGDEGGDGEVDFVLDDGGFVNDEDVGAAYRMTKSPSCPRTW